MDDPSSLPSSLSHFAPGSEPPGATFPADFADEFARPEAYNKHLYRPNTYLHKWWARRCGGTFRFILKHLVQDPARRDYYLPGGLEGKIILDPLLGCGTTLHEAIRLGANVIGADIDPIPVLQARATLSPVPLAELERAFAMFMEELSRRLSPYFQTSCPECGRPTPLIYTLHGQEQACGCGAAVIIDSAVLRNQSDGSQIVISRQCGRVHTVRGPEDDHACPGGRSGPTIREKRTRVCPDCAEPLRERRELPYHARFAPLAIAGRCPAHGFFVRTRSPADLELMRRADQLRPHLASKPADFVVVPGPKSGDLINHGVGTYLDLFSSRQLLYLSTAVELLGQLDRLTRLHLGLLVSTSAEFNSMLCGYKGGSRRRPGAICHTFSLHAYSFPFTALENNPVYPGRTSGSLEGLFHRRIRRACQWAAQPTERIIRDGKAVGVVPIWGEVDAGCEVHRPAELAAETRRFRLIQRSSVHLDLEPGSVDHIVTDPPYLDNVQYGDLSAFFRLRLRRLLPGEATWDYDLSESAVEQPGDGSTQYERVLGAILAECRRVLKPTGRLVFTFHHWSP